MPIGTEEMRAGVEELTRIVAYHLRSAQQALDCLNELHQRLEEERKTMKNYAGNAVCPRCGTFTFQQIVSRGVRKCDCGFEFNLADTERIQRTRGKLRVVPPRKTFAEKLVEAVFPERKPS